MAEILESLLGPSKEAIWQQIANDIGGDYIQGSFWDKDKLIYSHQEWSIILDTYSEFKNNTTTHYTRMWAPYINRDGLYFTIYQEGFFSTISKLFGMQDIIINDEYFDDRFIIKGNNDAKIQELLGCPELKKLIDLQPRVFFQVKSDRDWENMPYSEEVDFLYFQCVGIVTDKQVLFNLFELFTCALNRLLLIDSAYMNDPNTYLIKE